MTVVFSRACAAVLAAIALALVALVGPVPGSAIAQTTDEPQFLRLDIDQVTPSAVSLTSGPVVSVTGTVTNIGDRDVEDVWVRLQRAQAVADSATLRSALTLDQAGYDTVGEFEVVSDRIGQGDTEEFTLELPLRSDLVPSLDITEPGVYPLLVNVNGVPEYGGQARLDDARFLLPVLGVPAADEVGTGTDESTDTSGATSLGETSAEAGEKEFPAIAPEGSTPVPTTVLWPLADRPRIAAGVPGSATDPVRLVDDDLATSLAEGGRLDGLLRVAEEVVQNEQQVGDAMCLAIDPDLLVTVANMTRDYLVVADPADPIGVAEPGTGTGAAISWLERLRALSARMCTTAVPYAQADLTALAETGDASLIESALTSPTEIIDTTLGISSVGSVVWPDSGVLTEKAGTMIAANGPVTALLADDAVQKTDAGASGVRISGVDGLTAGLFDSAAGAALAAMGDDPQTPSYVPESSRYTLTDDSTTARLQDALGAIAWPALNSSSESASSAGPDSLVLAPPQVWSVSADDAARALSMVSTLMKSGLATAQPFQSMLSAAAATGSDPVTSLLTYPEQAITDGAPASVVHEASAQMPRLDGLENAFVEDPQAQLTPSAFTAPLRNDMLRSMTLAGRRGTDPDAAAAAAELRATEVREAVDRMFDSVTVLAPGGVFTLTSEQSPLLLVARNDLPVGITVRLHVDVPAAMDITDIGPTQLPPRGSRTLTVPAEISDSRKIEVEFALTTESGLSLGSPTQVTVRSNAYGQILAIVTGCAGALLLFLAGRRLLHRFRGEPDPADERLGEK
ncbi:glycoprotein [Rhodococcus sp. SJ-3]|uniref:glycoprotein n=1 Tax=Rhodococcus sp. SJ-3 TaxID=3454628 RepID=UPI003F7B01D5